ncbi:MAG: MFS transporter [Dehalococcoidia bacterium]
MQNPANSSADASETAGRGTSQQVVAVTAAGLGMFLAALDIAVNVGLPSLRSHFGTDLQTVQWVIVVFIATRAGLVMGAGSFADRFGLKTVYLFGTVTYLASMVLIALSPNLGLVVAFRALQALGTGCLYAVSPAIAAEVFPAHRRGLGMGFTTASQAFGMLAGTLGAGLLVQWFGWQAIFLGRIPFTLIALVLGLLFLQGRSRAAGQPPFDLIGAITLLGTLLSLVIGLRLGRSEGWTFWPVLVLLPLAPIFLAWFWRTEGRAAWPVLPKSLLRVPGFVASGSGMFLAHFGVFVVWFIFPFYIVDSLGRGPLALGVMLATMACFNIGFSAWGGWLSDWLGPRLVGTAGLVILGAGLLLMGFLQQDSPLAQVGVRIGIVGSGLGLFQAAAYALMLGSVAPDRYGTAGGALSLAQAFGTVLSVSIVGGIFALSSQFHLEQLAASGIDSAQLPAHAFILAFQDVFRLGAVVSGTGAVIFFILGRRPP